MNTPPKNTFKYDSKLWNIYEFLRKYGEITRKTIFNDFGEGQYNRALSNIRDVIEPQGWGVKSIGNGRFELVEEETQEGQKKLF